MAALVQSLTQFNNFFQKNPPKSPKTLFFYDFQASLGQDFDRLEVIGLYGLYSNLKAM